MLERLQRLAHLPPRIITAKAVGKVFGPAAEHHFTDRILNFPSPLWRPPLPWSRFTDDEGLQHIATMRREGIVILPGFFDAAQLRRIHDAVETTVASGQNGDMEFRASGQFYASMQPLAICPEFADGAVDSDLLNIVSGYFRRRPFLSESDFRRVLPLDMSEHERTDPKFAKGYSSSHWHHDLRGRQVKVMIYLTDVGAEDQNFVFCPGTHTGFKSNKYENSRFSDQQIAQLGIEKIECLAAAGTAIAFDTNGLHRLRRRKTRVRDSVTFNYHPGRMYRAIPQKVHPGVSAGARQRLAAFSVLV